ncbi:uncharacterized protein LOC108462490 [Gossypium arboreum]|uniref:Reverse transcriptase n=1 Tax=Gossypium arboreum TaxID=29729 RepID=A0ABR0NFW8_GOSAR|nr:uncharacterized protein LOC108462490 [Gossypium arboreum]KAK5793895.1 hypothetical protein PVK06_035069 [Gossypium arboreum]
MKCGFANGINVGASGSKGWPTSLRTSNVDFREVLEDCGLIDLGFFGGWFTWEHGRVLATNIREHLDRGIATQDWMSLFPSYHLEHLSHSFLDHCPILLDTRGRGGEFQRSRNRSFRFKVKWCLEHDFEAMVQRSWEDITETVPNKFMLLGKRFQQWSRSRSWDQKTIHRDFEERLHEVYDQDPSDEVLVEIIEAQIGINLEIDKEEIFWGQRAHANWLQNGDRNTNYFHKITV